MPELSIQTILQLLSLGIIVLWTTRLARSKGLNPWMWGVASVLLIALAWNFSPNFLAPVVIAPLIFLLLFRSPIFRRGKKAESMPCPSCGAPDTGGLNFCVQCGWDLSRSFTESSRQGQTTFNSAGMAETAVAEERAPEASPVRSEGTSEAEPSGVDGQGIGDAVQPPVQEAGQGASIEAGLETGLGSERDPVSEYAPDTSAGPVPEGVPDAVPTSTPEPVLAQEANSEPITDERSQRPSYAPPEPTPETTPESTPEPTPAPVAQPEPQQAPSSTASPSAGAPRVPRPIPTPANMTERGVSLFNQGRFQEAIDQFTKAIALDPDYKEAWERRAEAYGRLGRPERQKADQRRLKAF